MAEAEPGSSAEASALVTALEANFCRVRLDAAGGSLGEELLCVRRTRLGKSGQRICVGDRVQVEGIDWAERRGAIAAVAERSSLLQRPAVANCSRVVVVVALEQPRLDPLQLSRFLITAERTGVAVELVLTKADLRESPERQAWLERLRGWGYDPLAVSALHEQGLQPLRERLAQPGIAVFCGPSGVGKSSLINLLHIQKTLFRCDCLKIRATGISCQPNDVQCCLQLRLGKTSLFNRASQHAERVTAGIALRQPGELGGSKPPKKAQERRRRRKLSVIIVFG